MGRSESDNDIQMEEKHPDSATELLDRLHELKHTHPKAVRCHTHLYPPAVYDNHGEGSSSGQMRVRKITSWKMTEHLYFQPNNPFPTLARGLFTEEVENEDLVPPTVLEGGKRPKERIVARGYDKFFNINEVAWTNWDTMRDHTRPPYHLTLKSNGCLILISALSPSHIVVASKHSLGTTTEVQDAESEEKDRKLTEKLRSLDIVNGEGEHGIHGANIGLTPRLDTQHPENDSQVHAEVGRKWVWKTLKRRGRTEAELAKRLWDLHATAVLELCDDAFEEHVIATPAHWTGLHLHGLNHNTPHFSSATPAEVNSFADEFGFIATKFIEVQTLDEVKAITEKVAQSGSWEGDQIEGFVVRTTVKKASETAEGKPPYRPDAPFFFKVKFDEPYMLYRQWREVTRVMLPLLQQQTPAKQAETWEKARKRARRPEIGVYVDWVGEMMQKEPTLFHDYDRGIMRVRERFLTWTTEDGRQKWDAAKSGMVQAAERAKAETSNDKQGFPKKWIIVPVAIPGCGKTTIGNALSELFKFGHTQSDDVMTKKTAYTFCRNIVELLQKKDVVYADRVNLSNNHIDKHYNEIAELGRDKSLKKYDVRLIAILWEVQSLPYYRVLRLCSERVVQRGDNHQTLRPSLAVEAEHEAVVGKFLRDFEPPDPSLFDHIITVSISLSPSETLARIVSGVVAELGLSAPSDHAMGDALEVALAYKTSTPYHSSAKIGKAVRYFGLAPEFDLADIVQSALQLCPTAELTQSATDFLNHLKTSERITRLLHITLAHEKAVAEERESTEEGAPPGPQETLWETCKTMTETSTSPLYDFDLTYLIWDDRVMALSVDSLRTQVRDHPDQAVGLAKEGIRLEIPEGVRRVLHLSVGTKSEDIRAYESRGMVSAAKDGIAGGDESGEVGEAVEGGGKVRWFKLEGLKGEGRIRGMW